MGHEYSSSRSVFALLVLIGTCATAAEIPGAPGEQVQVGRMPGHVQHLHIHCSGPANPDRSQSNPPTVVLEAGLGGTSLEWERVQAMLNHEVRVCRYDRAGMGWSGPADGPRDSEHITDELHELLINADVPGPYVLVGHSFGGYTAQLFASRYPALSVGLVLVDSSHPDQIDRFAAPPVRSNIAPRGRLMVLMSGQTPSQLPEPQRQLAQQLASEYKARLATTRELEGFRASAAQLQAAAPLPDIPLVVLTRGLRQWPDDERGRLREALWQDLQAELALNSALGAQLIARRSGHFIHLDQPELVVQAIRMVIHTARRPSRDGMDRSLRQLAHRLGAESVALTLSPISKARLVTSESLLASEL